MKKLFLIIFGLFLAFLILEVFLRLPHPKPSRTTLKFYENDIFGSALVPNQKGWFVTQSQEYYTWVEVNSQGWPDVEHNLVKPEGVYRILILGDSFVENFQVSLEKRFFRQLQNNLGQKYEIIAMGRGNTGTAQQYLILKNYGLKYKPDLVIQMFFEANDVKNNSPTLQNDPFLPYFKLDENQNPVEIKPQKRSERRLAVIKEFLKRSRVMELLLSLRQKMIEKANTAKYGYPPDYHVYDNNYSEEYVTAWNITQKLILETKKITEQSGSKYLLVAFPGNEQVQKDVQQQIVKTYPQFDLNNIDFEKPDIILKNFCSEEKLDCLFILPYFQNYISSNSDARLYNYYDGHWTETGINLVEDFIEKNLLHYFSIK